jgi:hypothetical protein
MLRKLLLGTAAAAVTLGLVSTANAADHRHESHGHRVEVRHYEGHRFKGGVYYHRHDHPRWERHEWDARYHRYHYYAPAIGVWYYWNAGSGCYYPDTYCP